MSTDAPLSLADLSAALASRAAQTGRRYTWAAVDSSDSVLWVERTWEAAHLRLNELFDRDNSAVESARLVRLDAGVLDWCDWPRRGTPRERALAFVRGLDAVDNYTDEDLVRLAEQHYLRATPSTLEAADGARDALWLWWMSEATPRLPVGLVVRLAPREWVFLADERTPGLDEQEVLRRLGEAVSCFCAEEVPAAALKNIVNRGRVRLSPAGLLLGRLAVNVAQRLGLLGGEWSIAGSDGDA